MTWGTSAVGSELPASSCGASSHGSPSTAPRAASCCRGTARRDQGLETRKLAAAHARGARPEATAQRAPRPPVDPNALLRVSRLLVRPDAMRTNADVIGRVLAAWRAREGRPARELPGPERNAMLDVLARAACAVSSSAAGTRGGSAPAPGRRGGDSGSSRRRLRQAQAQAGRFAACSLASAAGRVFPAGKWLL